MKPSEVLREAARRTLSRRNAGGLCSEIIRICRVTGDNPQPIINTLNFMRPLNGHWYWFGPPRCKGATIESQEHRVIAALFVADMLDDPN